MFAGLGNRTALPRRRSYDRVKEGEGRGAGLPGKRKEGGRGERQNGVQGKRARKKDSYLNLFFRGLIG